MTDWEEIKDRYICTRLSAGELAEEFGVTKEAVKGRIRRGNWVKLRKRMLSGDMDFRIERLTDRLLRRLERAADGSGELDSKEIKTMTAALRELRELRAELGQSADEGDRTLEVRFLGETEEMSR